MLVSDYRKRRPAYSVITMGAGGAGKTRLGCGFPKILYIGTDPTGLDTVLYDPANAKLAANVVEGAVLNGLPLDEIFANDETSPTSIYGLIEQAKRGALEGRISTIFLDNLTYLVDLKWQQIDGDNAKDKRQAFGQVATFASDLVLSRLLPMATRHGINVVIAMHIQRESKDAVEGISEAAAQVAASPQKQAQALQQLGQSKRHINLKSDLSPMVLGSLRQKIGGMPSAMLWLNNEVGAPDPKTGQPTLRYLAYTQKQWVPAWDTEVDAKNRYGLPPVLDLTNASLYATLVQTSRAALEAQKAKVAAGAQATSEATVEATK